MFLCFSLFVISVCSYASFICCWRSLWEICGHNSKKQLLTSIFASLGIVIQFVVSGAVSVEYVLFHRKWCHVLFLSNTAGRPTIWITAGQGPTALAVGAGGGGCLDIFTLICPFSPLSPSLWETVRYRLKYCLKGPLNSKQPTNQSVKLCC